MPFRTRIMDIRNERVLLDRYHLTPMTPWGQLCFHVFHGGDTDRHLHNHPWDFWTFPFSDYWEERPEGVGRTGRYYVAGWRLHYRPAEWTHRVLGKAVSAFSQYADPTVKFCSLVWRKPDSRLWGFYVDDKFYSWATYRSNPELWK